VDNDSHSLACPDPGLNLNKLLHCKKGAAWCPKGAALVLELQWSSPDGPFLQ